MIPIIATTKKIYLVTSLGGFNFPILTWGLPKKHLIKAWSSFGSPHLRFVVDVVFFPHGKNKTQGWNDPSNDVLSGKLTFCYGISPFWMDKSTISIAIFYVANCKRLPGRVSLSWSPSPTWRAASRFVFWRGQTDLGKSTQNWDNSFVDLSSKHADIMGISWIYIYTIWLFVT